MNLGLWKGNNCIICKTCKKWKIIREKVQYNLVLFSCVTVSVKKCRAEGDALPGNI